MAEERRKRKEKNDDWKIIDPVVYTKKKTYPQIDLWRRLDIVGRKKTTTTTTTIESSLVPTIAEIEIGQYHRSYVRTAVTQCSSPASIQQVWIVFDNAVLLRLLYARSGPQRVCQV